MPKETLHVGVLDVVCTATFTFGEDGTLHVALLDGVREFELQEWEVERLYEAISAQRQRRRVGRESS